MTMPIDLILVRHGESEGNAANTRSRKGDHSDFTPEFLARHSSEWRLTDRGIRQIKATGEWIKTNIALPFDRYYTSEYVRAMETAVILDLPGAVWYVESYLRERDYGILDIASQKERVEKYGDYLKKRKNNPLFSIPPNGESLADLCLRTDRVLNTLHRECSLKRVIIVCHGEVMEALEIRIKRLLEMDYKKSISDSAKIFNGQIVHYTRCNPQTGEIASHINWVRSIRPEDPSYSREWQEIFRSKYSNENLMSIVSQFPRMIND